MPRIAITNVEAYCDSVNESAEEANFSPRYRFTTPAEVYVCRVLERTTIPFVSDEGGAVAPAPVLGCPDVGDLKLALPPAITTSEEQHSDRKTIQRVCNILAEYFDIDKPSQVLLHRDDCLFVYRSFCSSVSLPHFARHLVTLFSRALLPCRRVVWRIVPSDASVRSIGLAARR